MDREANGESEVQTPAGCQRTSAHSNARSRAAQTPFFLNPYTFQQKKAPFGWVCRVTLLSSAYYSNKIYILELETQPSTLVKNVDSGATLPETET